MLSTHTAQHDKSPTENWFHCHWFHDFNAAFCLLRADTNFKWFSIVVISRPVYADLSCCRRHIRCGHGVTHLLRRNKATSVSDSRPSAPWVLSSAGQLIRYLHGSHFLPYNFSFSFSVFEKRRFPLLFFMRHLFLSLQLGCSLNALSSTSWVDSPLTADWLQVCFGTSAPTQFSKTFLKILHTPPLTVPCAVRDHTTFVPHPSHLFKRAGEWLSEPHWTRYRAVTIVKWTGLWGSISA